MHPEIARARRALDEGRAGVLVPPDDPRTLADGIRTLLADTQEATRLGQAGRQRAIAHYTVDRMLDGVEAVYREVLD